MVSEVKDKTYYDEETVKLLKAIQRETVEQKKYIKKRYTVSKISAAALVCLSAFVIMFGVNITSKINTIYHDMSIIAQNAKQISNELSEIDFKAASDNINTLINESETTLKTTNDKLNSVDFEALNEAINDLKNVIKPLADFFGR